MYFFARIFVYLLLASGTVCGFVLVFIEKKYWWRRFIIFLIVIALSLYFVFGCTSPLQPKVKACSIEKGILNIFEFATNGVEPYVDGMDLYEYNRKIPDLYIEDDVAMYIVEIYRVESDEIAEKDFIESTSGYYEIEEGENIKYYVTKYFRSRDWDRLLGVSSDCVGGIEALYGSYVISIMYIYDRNLFEETVSVMCSPETFYREEIDLGSIDLEKASIEFV